MAAGVHQFRLRTVFIVLGFYGLILALVMQTLRAERLEAQLRQQVAAERAMRMEAAAMERRATALAALRESEARYRAAATKRAEQNASIPD